MRRDYSCNYLATVQLAETVAQFPIPFNFDVFMNAESYWK